MKITMLRTLDLQAAPFFITFLFFGISLSFTPSSAQDTTAATPDTIRADSIQSDQLKKFKKAFEKLIKMEEAAKRKKEDEQVTDPELSLEGFVLDKTRSRTGRTFYELFYQNWQAPENASYYTITISEQPTPMRGTQIIITMNYQRILNFRLQPKYHFIEKISKQAAVYVHQKLKKQSSIEEQLIF